MASEITGELRAMFDQWFASIGARDGSFVERALLPDFKCVDPEGRVIDRPAYRAMYDALPADATLDYVMHEFEVRPLGAGDAACVSGWYRGRIIREGAVISDKNVRFLGVWERTPAGWRGVYHQTTSRPPEPPAT